MFVQGNAAPILGDAPRLDTMRSGAAAAAAAAAAALAALPAEDVVATAPVADTLVPLLLEVLRWMLHMTSAPASNGHAINWHATRSICLFPLWFCMINVRILEARYGTLLPASAHTFRIRVALQRTYADIKHVVSNTMRNIAYEPLHTYADHCHQSDQSNLKLKPASSCYHKVVHERNQKSRGCNHS